MDDALRQHPRKLTAPDDREPVAIIGIGCRFPGAVDSPRSLWRALVGELDAIGEIPPDRFDAASLYQPGPPAAGRIGTLWGGFLDGIDRFDADFFGVAPREADRLDPQQRLLLEVCWEALEDAGVPADRVAGSRTGVFVGLWLSDFEARLFENPAAADFYMTTGSGRYSASGRVSYALGLQGPALTVDTACSSSLVAVHLACQSLWSGESELALAGGANVILQPHVTIAYSQSSMMAPDGRCKFGDARANGYVRSEGAGMVLLKPLARALEDGDPVYAVIRGSAVNNDGRSGEYMATPAQAGQEQMLRLAYGDAGVSPGRVAYVEAHGTGTGAGDPVELGALGAVLGEGRTADQPCVVGSIKTNFGHTEGAAGVAGLVKAALVLRHREIPASLHFREPNPNIPWATLPLSIARERQPLAVGNGPALAGVSAFGIAGTNAHVVLEEAPAGARRHEGEGSAASAPEPGAAAEAPVLVPLSARTPEALAELAGAWVALTEQDDAPPLDALAYAAGCHRTHMDARAAVVAGSVVELKERMAALAAGDPAPGVVSGTVGAERPRVVFVFPGQGSQWLGMARELLEHEPVFRAELEACEAAMRPFVEWSLLEQLQAEPNSPAYAMERIDVVQPVLVAVDLALAELWRARGVEPDAVVGHSMGEVAAACFAGALSREDALHVVCLRSQLMRRTSGQGRMASVELSMDEARDALEGFEDVLSIGASNSPRSTILSGDPDALASVLEELEARDVFCRMVKVDVASHSPQMQPLCAELASGLAALAPRASRLRVLSTVTGAAIDGSALGADYWVRNLRQPVLFSHVVQSLLAEGADTFIEMSPHPVLLPAIEQTARTIGRPARTLPSLRRQEPERATLLQSLGALWAAGSPVDFARLHPGGGAYVRLPAYPWQRERFWHEGEGGVRARRTRAGAHPLLGEAVRSANGAVVWEVDVGTALQPYLADHRVRGRAVLPAAAYMEMAMAAGLEAFGGRGVSVADLAFEEALFLEEDGSAASVQVLLESDLAGAATLRVFSRSAGAGAEGGDGAWTLHARATLVASDEAAPAVSAAEPGQDATAAVLARVLARGEGEAEVEADPADGGAPERASGQEHYREMAARGLDYGAAFQGVAEVWRDGREALARLDRGASDASAAGGYRLHPALLDACLQLLLQTVGGEGDPGDTYLPLRLDRFELLRRPEADEGLSARALRTDGEGFGGDVHLLDGQGRPLARALGLRFHRLAAGGDVGDWLYRPQWLPAPRAEAPAGQTAAPGHWLILADRGGVGNALAARIVALGGTFALATPAGAFEAQGAGRFGVDPAAPASLARLVREAVGAVGALAGVVHLWGLDTTVGALGAPAADAPPAAPDATDLGVVAALHVVQALAAAGVEPAPRLCLVTAGAQPVGKGAGAEPMQATLWGMAGVLAHEHPELRSLCVDLDPADALGGVEALATELLGADREDRVALRQGQRWAPRLIRHRAEAEAETGGAAAADADADAAASARGDAPHAGPYRVVTTAPGVLDGLAPRLTPRRAPAPGQVEIEVRATGLNFMNVMSALGIYPGFPEGVGPLGIECAGVVAQVGDGVERFRAGDRVVAYAFDSLATHALADAHLVAPLPAALDFTSAATLPIGFLTAHYALNHLARMERGERVLIHAATGGVGLAAIQLARRAGAEVFATAGSEAKRAHLRSLGVEHVFDSRSLAFADEVLERTGGEGVDVVLNSLSGAAIARGLGLLRPYGRFVEIGKKDIYDDARVGLAPFRNNLSYFAVDLERMARERPALLGGMLQELMAAVDAGALTALPAREFPVSEVGDAFRHMAQARHIGKVVVRLQDAAELPDLLPAESPVRPDASYLVTGGLGGLGLAVARWLAERGARHLVLVGRGAPGGDAVVALEALERAGVQVLVAQADVTSGDDLARLLGRIEAELPPLRGVVHAAGVLADGTVLQTDRERFRRALAPKVEGALHLHALTAGLPLDFFVLFSSVAALLGTSGQANYAAANAFLDALAQLRQAGGLPGTSIGWGPWSEVGLAAARADRGGRLALQGLESLTPEQGVAAFQRVLMDTTPYVAVMRFDPARWSEVHPAARSSTFLELLQAAEPEAPAEASGSGILAALAAAGFDGERRALMGNHLRERAAEVLRLAPERVVPDRPLKAMGMDSLMTLELRNRLEADLKLTISATAIWNYPTVTLLAAHLAERLGAAAVAQGDAVVPLPPPVETRAPAEKAPSADENGASGPADTDALTRAELESLLDSELAGIDDLLGNG